VGKIHNNTSCDNAMIVLTIELLHCICIRLRKTNILASIHLIIHSSYHRAQLLDVSYETSDGFHADAASAALRAQQTSSTSLSLVGIEGDQPDQEEAAQSGGTSYSFQNIIQMAQLV